MMEKSQAKEPEVVQEEWRNIERQTFNFIADTEQALARFNKKWQYNPETVQTNANTQCHRGSRPTAEDKTCRAALKSLQHFRRKNTI